MESVNLTNLKSFLDALWYHLLLICDALLPTLNRERLCGSFPIRLLEHDDYLKMMLRLRLAFYNALCVWHSALGIRKRDVNIPRLIEVVHATEIRKLHYPFELTLGGHQHWDPLPVMREYLAGEREQCVDGEANSSFLTNYSSLSTHSVWHLLRRWWRWDTL
jgi:hypothetical protein